MTASDEDRAALESAVGSVLFNAMNFPERVQARLLGQDMKPLNEKLTDAILAAGFRRQGEVTDREIDAAARAYAGDELSDEEWAFLETQPEIFQPYLDGMRAALEAAKAVTR